MRSHRRRGRGWVWWARSRARAKPVLSTSQSARVSHWFSEAWVEGRSHPTARAHRVAAARNGMPLIALYVKTYINKEHTNAPAPQAVSSPFLTAAPNAVPRLRVGDSQHAPLRLTALRGCDFTPTNRGYRPKRSHPSTQPWVAPAAGRARRCAKPRCAAPRHKPRLGATGESLRYLSR